MVQGEGTTNRDSDLGPLSCQDSSLSHSCLSSHLPHPPQDSYFTEEIKTTWQEPPPDSLPWPQSPSSGAPPPAPLPCPHSHKASTPCSAVASAPLPPDVFLESPPQETRPCSALYTSPSPAYRDPFQAITSVPVLNPVLGLPRLLPSSAAVKGAGLTRLP